MERETAPSSSRGDREEDAKVIEWEEFDDELTRLWSLSSALKLATEKKLTLQPKLESLIQVSSLIPMCCPFCELVWFLIRKHQFLVL